MGTHADGEDDTTNKNGEDERRYEQSGETQGSTTGRTKIEMPSRKWVQGGDVVFQF